MALLPLQGHQAARNRVANALAAARFPQVLLVTGPEGAGKQRFGLWLGQLLLCERPGQDPCGTCQSCRKSVAVEHPDLHWFVPIERPKAGEQEKQIEEAGDRIGEQVVIRREKGRWGPAEGMASHGVASAHLLLRRAALTPVLGRRKVFVVGEANRLVPQESSPEAANALLKLLEEPAADTVIVLTSAAPEQVLPTIRSRAVRLRLAPLSDQEVRRFAAAHLPELTLGPADVRKAQGCIGRLINTGDGEERASRTARALLEAVMAGSGARYERALAQAPWQARGGFTDLLDALAAELSETIRAAKAEPPAEAVNALSRVLAARDQAQGNVNPQLILAALADELVPGRRER